MEIYLNNQTKEDAPVYLNNFTSKEDIAEEFSGERFEYNPKAKAGGRADILGQLETVHLAWYGDGDYCGDALVIYENGGKLYHVEGGHCSCYGLEGQWDPTETTWKAVGMIVKARIDVLSEYSSGYEGEKQMAERLLNLCVEHGGIEIKNAFAVSVRND